MAPLSTDIVPNPRCSSPGSEDKVEAELRERLNTLEPEPSREKLQSNSSSNSDSPPVQAEAKTPKSPKYELEIVWKNIYKFTFLHLVALCGLYLLPQMSWSTIFFGVAQYILACLVGLISNGNVRLNIQQFQSQTIRGLTFLNCIKYVDRWILWL